jgi:hypothetical protein
MVTGRGLTTAIVDLRDLRGLACHSAHPISGTIPSLFCR